MCINSRQSKSNDEMWGRGMHHKNGGESNGASVTWVSTLVYEEPRHHFRHLLRDYTLDRNCHLNYRHDEELLADLT
jgi:hypothetical protein